MLLGQPTVAKMRECLGKLEVDALCAPGGLDDGATALEELEYYAEDLDNAGDLVKIGGLAALRRCCALGLLDADEANATEVEAVQAAEEEAAALREAACGVLAAMVQNHPKVAKAARGVGIPQLLLALLSGGGTGPDTERVGGAAVVRKALLALSALMRTGEEPDAPTEANRTLSAAAAAVSQAGDQPTDAEIDRTTLLNMALPTLRRLAVHSDLKVRRRTVFLLASLSAERPADAFAVAAATDDALLNGLLDGVGHGDEDIRTQSSRLLLSLCGDGLAPGEQTSASTAFSTRLGELGGVARVSEAAQRATVAGESDPDEKGRLERLVAYIGRDA